jgi:hypothetical protein
MNNPQAVEFKNVKKYMNRFVLKNTFIKVYIYHFLINIFYRNKKSKLCFRERVAVQNDFLYENGESTS